MDIYCSVKAPLGIRHRNPVGESLTVPVGPVCTGTRSTNGVPMGVVASKSDPYATLFRVFDLVPVITTALEIMHLCTRPRLLHDDLCDHQCPPQTFPSFVLCRFTFFCFIIRRESMRGTPSYRHQNTAIACDCVVCNVQLASIMSDSGRAKGGYAEPELLVINIEALPHYKKVVESNGHSSHLKQARIWRGGGKNTPPKFR